MPIRSADKDRPNGLAGPRSNYSRLAPNSYRHRLRRYADRSASVLIGVSGVGVLVAILAIFFYLVVEVVPLFQGARVTEGSEVPLTSRPESPPLFLALEESGEMAMWLSVNGEAEFISFADRSQSASLQVAALADSRVTTFARDESGSNVFALGLETGEVFVGSYRFLATYPDASTQRRLTPQLLYPYGTQSLMLFNDSPIVSLAVSSSDEGLLLIGQNDRGEVSLLRLTEQSDLLSGYLDGSRSDRLVSERLERFTALQSTQRLFVGGQQRWLYTLSNSGLLRLYDLDADPSAAVVPTVETAVLPAGVSVGDARLLLGGRSIVIGDSRGRLTQWTAVDRNGGREFQQIREFRALPRSIRFLVAEQRRKNFLAVDAAGNLAFFNTTAERQLLRTRLPYSDLEDLTLSPDGKRLLLATSRNGLQLYAIDNDHPEVSWSALWSQVWYEGYADPEYIWQSSASSSEFEPKYSLVPLTFGTLKAAFVAMMFAAPLAVCGAVYTGYFMAPAMRRKVKPLIELMEALPTVVLGFIAGLWMAPFVERHLLAVFIVLLSLPLAILLASLLWTAVPRRWRTRVPDGWEAAILLPLLLLMGLLVFALSGPIESLFFAGDIRSWISVELGIDYDQRNALVVGFAMGFAVIPTIFTIAEDAVFNVPRHLTYGSLALGSTPWQSLYRVVLPTASPGIFSALMIGLGRAVGETMIVLMATGNTPIMEVNIFEGMRTLAANIAVEIPESEVGSTHYRLLFLTALLLFVFTFLVNTVAELVRQKLRSRYRTI